MGFDLVHTSSYGGLYGTVGETAREGASRMSYKGAVFNPFWKLFLRLFWKPY